MFALSLRRFCNTTTLFFTSSATVQIARLSQKNTCLLSNQSRSFANKRPVANRRLHPLFAAVKTFIMFRHHQTSAPRILMKRRVSAMPKQRRPSEKMRRAPLDRSTAAPASRLKCKCRVIPSTRLGINTARACDRLHMLHVHRPILTFKYCHFTWANMHLCRARTDGLNFKFSASYRRTAAGQWGIEKRDNGVGSRVNRFCGNF